MTGCQNYCFKIPRIAACYCKVIIVYFDMPELNFKFFVLIIIIFISQKSYPRIPRRANIVIIENHSLSGNLLLNRCIAILENDSYEICNLNRDSLYLTTNSYFISNFPVLIYYRLSVTDSLVILRGFVMDLGKVDSNGDSGGKISWNRSAYRSIPGSLWRIGFERMEILTEKIRSALSGKVYWTIEDSTPAGKSRDRINFTVESPP